MKQIIGTPINIEEDVLGRITLKKRNVFSRKDYILVANDLTGVPLGYSAAITNSKTLIRGIACVVEKQKLCEFHEGDVVLISNKGVIVFLYEIKSLHNASCSATTCQHDENWHKKALTPYCAEIRNAKRHYQTSDVTRHTHPTCLSCIHAEYYTKILCYKHFRPLRDFIGT